LNIGKMGFYLTYTKYSAFRIRLAGLRLACAILMREPWHCQAARAMVLKKVFSAII
jgi:hypothetical protein